ncbi:uncharacterized protein I206_104649 [Kwoniella pini CBS 10737]|uniref:Uncharacterized protein n=1 Tax=Kwoniella pini CBS 10737 TaxID=1296096 RepID=A0A1B9I7H5_9TREE|nr:uncharacterized protein I206_02187 [Kwoniella pini CBS 10737]OCF51473.1 hypothetical protein I206_02187 [Kwoniella pini CBS 10737]
MVLSSLWIRVKKYQPTFLGCYKTTTSSHYTVWGEDASLYVLLVEDPGELFANMDYKIGGPNSGPESEPFRRRIAGLYEYLHSRQFSYGIELLAGNVFYDKEKDEIKLVNLNPAMHIGDPCLRAEIHERIIEREKKHVSWYLGFSSHPF